jgi:DNA-binding SARP family transcriptional activator
MLLSLKLLGPMSATLHHGERQEILALTPKLSELLAFLAVGRGRYFAREEIVASLWNTEEEGAHARLNTALCRLRRVIERAPLRAGDFLVKTPRGDIGLNGPRSVELDVALFEELARSGLQKPIAELTPTDADALRRALALYKGDALADFSRLWALRERERLRSLYLDSALRMMHVSETIHEPDAALAYGYLP